MANFLPTCLLSLNQLMVTPLSLACPQNCLTSLNKSLPLVNRAYCRRLLPATILTGLIAALTRFPELLLYAYPCTRMTTSSDLETVDVSWITWVNCSFRISAIFILYYRCICEKLTFYNATKWLHVECLFNLASFSIARTYHYIVWQTSTWQNKNYIFGNDAIPTHYYWPIIAKKIT